MFRPSLHSHCSPIPAAALLAATVLGLLFSRRVVRADVGELPEPGGLVTPGDKTDEIRMDSEFRLHSSLDPAGSRDPANASMRQAKNARVLVEGREVPVSYAELALLSQERVVAAVFAVDFPVETLTFDPTRFGGGENATTPAAPEKLTVRAFVDGRSRLVITGDELYWHHLDFAAPGRWSDPAYTRTHDEPTYLNGVPWVPVWPNRPDRENRDCNCYSSSTAGFPQLTLPGWAATLDVEQGRGRVAIVRQPEAANDYTLIVEFDDNDWDGADWYEVTLGSAAAAPPAGARAAHGPIITTLLPTPTAHGQLVTTPQDTPVDITLTASHPERKPLTFVLVDRPSHGSLAGMAPSLIYLPQAGYIGSDAFTFRAGDGQYDLEAATVSLIVGLPAESLGECTGPNLLRNGDFEADSDGQGVGLGWGSFHTAGGAVYTFQDDRWSPVVCEGSHSQFIGIGTANVLPAADRFAGIYQTVTGLEPGAVYELSIASLMREEAAHLEDPYRYQVQWAYSSQGHQDWTQAAGWQDLPWNGISLRTDPGTFSTHTARLVAPSEPLTLFLRAWKKWATSGRELDVNLDAIVLRRCASAP